MGWIERLVQSLEGVAGRVLAVPRQAGLEPEFGGRDEEMQRRHDLDQTGRQSSGRRGSVVEPEILLRELEHEIGVAVAVDDRAVLHVALECGPQRVPAGPIGGGELDGHEVSPVRGQVMEHHLPAAGIAGSGVAVRGAFHRRFVRQGIVRGAPTACGAEILCLLLDQIPEQPESEPKRPGLGDQLRIGARVANTVHRGSPQRNSSGRSDFGTARYPFRTHPARDEDGSPVLPGERDPSACERAGRWRDR